LKVLPPLPEDPPSSPFFHQERRSEREETHETSFFAYKSRFFYLCFDRRPDVFGSLVPHAVLSFRDFFSGLKVSLGGAGLVPEIPIWISRNFFFSLVLGVSGGLVAGWLPIAQGLR